MTLSKYLILIAEILLAGLAVCAICFPFRKIREVGADLQLSGHTHAGQLFPLKTLYALAGLNVVGDYRIDGNDLYVSSGVSGWYLPLRNESHCYYEVFELSAR